MANEENRQTWFDWANEMIKECGDWENTEGMSEAAYDRLMAIVAAMRT